MKKIKNKNPVQITADLIEFLNQPDDQNQAPKKFSDMALYLSEKVAGGAAWDSLCEMRKLISKLPAGMRKDFEKHLNIISVALHCELNEFKKLHVIKSKKQSSPVPLYSPAYRLKAISIFKDLDPSKSKTWRALKVIKELKSPDLNSRAKTKPSARTIINWVKSANK